ncbi:MAG: hypothetical protein V1806_02340 [Pseudomonadota bacterium]
MNPTQFAAWQERLEVWLADQPALPTPPWPGASLPGQVALILAQARLLARAIAASLEGVGLTDRNKYDFILEELERFLGFQEFSLAEYTYELPGGRHPGLRLLLEEEQWTRRVAVLWFEDVRLWRVDERGGKVSHQLLLLELGPAGIQPRVDPVSHEYYQPSWGWARCLRQALCLPVLLAG